MSGHSKWKTIKHKKALTDLKRGRAFTKLLKEISVAARAGGGDPLGNPRLRFLLDKGRDINMPLDNAVRAIKKGTGELPGQHYESHCYEGFGPGGIAVIVEVLSDNRNRAIAEIRHVFSRNGGTVAEGGAVSWMFERRGVVRGNGKHFSEEELLEKLIDYPVEDISPEEDCVEVTCDLKALDDVKNALLAIGYKIEDANPEWVAKNQTDLEGESEEKAVAFLEALEELEDVQDVYTNLR